MAGNSDVACPSRCELVVRAKRGYDTRAFSPRCALFRMGCPVGCISWLPVYTLLGCLPTRLRYAPSMPRPWYNVVNLLAAQSMQRCKEWLKRGNDWLVTYRSCSDVTMVRKYPLVLQLRIGGVSCSTIAPRSQRSEFVVNFLDTRCEAKHHIQIAKQDLTKYTTPFSLRNRRTGFEGSLRSQQPTSS